MKYLIIGGAGFIGSHVVDAIVARGDEVVVMDNLISGNKDFLPPSVEFIWGDIRSSQDTDRVFRNQKYDRVINLAAQPYVPHSYDDPALFFETNANGTLNVLLACEKYKIPRLLQYASAEEYGTQKGKIDENVAIRPQSTYGVSKVASDYLCQVRNKESGVQVVILRQFNCYGPRETHEYVIPEIISQFARSRSVKLGNTKAERDFLFVEDAAQYALEILEKGVAGETYNLGAETCISIQDLAHEIAGVMKVEEPEIVIDPARFRPWDIERLQSDNTKIHSVVSYRAKTGLRNGLIRTVDYFYSNSMEWHF